jgi:signal transduction histidine kinase
MTKQPHSRDDGMVTTTMTDRRANAAWVGVVFAILNTIGVAIAYVLSRTHTEDWSGSLQDNGAWINLIAGPTFPLLTSLMLRARSLTSDRPRHELRLAWLLLGFGTLCSATLVLHTLAEETLARHAPGALAVAWVSSWLWVGVANSALVILVWFPTGAAPAGPWRMLPPLALVSTSLMWVSVAFSPGAMTDFASQPRNPVGVNAAAQVFEIVGGLGFLLLAANFVLTVASVVRRFQVGDRDIRRQLRWLVLAVGLLVLTIVIPVPSNYRTASVALNVVTALLIPLTLAVALVRRDGLGTTRLLVFGMLSALLLTGYLVTVEVSYEIFGTTADSGASIVGAGIVAVLVAPLHSRLQRAADRVTYGDRGDPNSSVAELARRAATSPGDLLEQMVASVVDAMRTTGASVHLVGEQSAAVTLGTLDWGVCEQTLELGGQPVGMLSVALRGRNESFGQRDLRLIADLARHVSVAAHAAALTRDLQRSRESLVVAREEERRRIRRDLHDGLGPALAGVALGIDAARNALPSESRTTAANLDELRREVLAAVADVRRLVYDLRPPALDQLGLVPALEHYAARISEGGNIAVTVSSQPLPELSAAVEVAAYRIATEALTNVARHSAARSSTVQIAVEGTGLRIEVIDDGIGAGSVPTGVRMGVGMTSMAERARELGGSWTIQSTTGRGTSVVALLPLRGTA